MNTTDPIELPLGSEPERHYDQIVLANIALLEELVRLHQVAKPVDHQRVIKLNHYKNLMLEWLDTRHRLRINKYQMDRFNLDQLRQTVYLRPNTPPPPPRRRRGKRKPKTPKQKS